MKRTTLNFVVDSAGFLNLLLLAGTGAILKWVLPPGSGGGHGRAFRGGRGQQETELLLGLGRHDWGDIHFVLAMLFLLLVLVHLCLHWSWIKTCGKSILLRSGTAPCDRGNEPANE